MPIGRWFFPQMEAKKGRDKRLNIIVEQIDPEILQGNL